MLSPEAERPSLAFIGGTGPEGRGLAMRFARQGHTIVIGSRSQERAGEAADQIGQAVEGSEVVGLTNEEAAHGADLVFITIPYSGVRATLSPLWRSVAGKIVVSAV